MKIILTAFNNKLTSKPMDVPDNTTERWKMRLYKPTTVITGFRLEHLADRESFETECEFEWTGKVILDNETEEGIRIYDLVNIRKIKAL